MSFFIFDIFQKTLKCQVHAIQFQADSNFCVMTEVWAQETNVDHSGFCRQKIIYFKLYQTKLRASIRVKKINRTKLGDLNRKKKTRQVQKNVETRN